MQPGIPSGPLTNASETSPASSNVRMQQFLGLPAEPEIARADDAFHSPTSVRDHPLGLANPAQMHGPVVAIPRVALDKYCARDLRHRCEVGQQVGGEILHSGA